VFVIKNSVVDVIFVARLFVCESVAERVPNGRVTMERRRRRREKKKYSDILVDNSLHGVNMSRDESRGRNRRESSA
jgi:hypothetical protein